MNGITFYALIGSPIDGTANTEGMLMAYRTTSNLYGADFYIDQTGMYFRTCLAGAWTGWITK